MINTAESVTFCHPDKICDQISDAILDECLMFDVNSRVAVETMGGHGKIFLMGEITTNAQINYIKVAEDVYRNLTGKDIYVSSHIVEQSPDIAIGVDTGGAGDQGVQIGYACNENEAKIPHEMYLARKLLKPYKVDGKSQVTVVDGRIDSVVLSIQGKRPSYLKRHIYDVCGEVDAYCNNTGSFEIGGFDADSGVTGRKIVVDSYGPRVPVGGGAFSGKDPTKVDRSGAYMARFIALNILKETNLIENEVLVKLGYVIGKAEPLMAVAEIRRQSRRGNNLQVVETFDIDQKKFDCRPQAIIERFDLKRPIYLDLAKNGHFGIKSYPWENV